MTRREREIQQAMKESVAETIYASGYGFTPQATDLLECAFIKGAQWADKTMIDKAREWFNLHFRQVGTPREIKHDFQSKEKMWKSFTQFMEE